VDHEFEETRDVRVNRVAEDLKLEKRRGAIGIWILPTVK